MDNLGITLTNVLEVEVVKPSKAIKFQKTTFEKFMEWRSKNINVNNVPEIQSAAFITDNKIVVDLNGKPRTTSIVDNGKIAQSTKFTDGKILDFASGKSILSGIEKETHSDSISIPEKLVVENRDGSVIKELMARLGESSEKLKSLQQQNQELSNVVKDSQTEVEKLATEEQFNKKRYEKLVEQKDFLIAKISEILEGLVTKITVMTEQEMAAITAAQAAIIENENKKKQIVEDTELTNTMIIRVSDIVSQYEGILDSLNPESKEISIDSAVDAIMNNVVPFPDAENEFNSIDEPVRRKSA